MGGFLKLLNAILGNTKPLPTRLPQKKKVCATMEESQNNKIDTWKNDQPETDGQTTKRSAVMNKVFLMAVVLCGSAILSSCATPIRSVDKAVRQSDIPPVGEIKTAELGAGSTKCCGYARPNVE